VQKVVGHTEGQVRKNQLEDRDEKDSNDVLDPVDDSRKKKERRTKGGLAPSWQLFGLDLCNKLS